MKTRSDGTEGKSLSRNKKEWEIKPALPDTHVVSTELFTSAKLFKEEVENIWHKVWLPICHESELPEVLDYRTSGIAGNVPIVVVRVP